MNACGFNIALLGTQRRNSTTSQLRVVVANSRRLLKIFAWSVSAEVATSLRIAKSLIVKFLPALKRMVHHLNSIPRVVQTPAWPTNFTTQSPKSSSLDPLAKTLGLTIPTNGRSTTVEPKSLLLRPQSTHPR